MGDPAGGPCCGPRQQRSRAASQPDAGTGSQAHGATDGMVLLDGGDFLMGSDARDGFAADGEGPVRRVGLSPFWVDPVALSNARFAAFVEATGQINSVATPLLAYGIAVALGGSGFIAAFVAGIAFGALAGEQAEATTFLAEESGELLNAVTFLLFGAVLLGLALGDPDWRVIGYAVLSLTVVRLLPVALSTVGTGMRRVTIGFLGWFGPRGLASIVFVLILVEQTDLPERPLLLDVVTWTVALSVYAHGMSAWPGANRYADWYAAHTQDHAAMPESSPVPEARIPVSARPSGR